MKKLLFVCDGGNFSQPAFEFIKWMHTQVPLTVTGVFFNPIDFEQLVSMSNLSVDTPFLKLKEEEKKLVSASETKFKALAEAARIRYTIHDRDEEWSRDLLIRETRFADLLVISGELFCANVFAGQPNVFMKETLHRTECPVFIIPEKFEPFDRVVVAYDGLKECMYAVRQFCYLFPELTALPTEFVYMKDEKNEEIPDLDALREFTRNHFSNLNISKLHFDGRKYFASWMDEKKGVMLVTGAFSRPAISTVLHRSFADQLINEHNAPIFLAHNV